MVEAAIKASGLTFTFLRPNLYMQGLLNFRESIRQQRAFFAAAGDARINAVDVRDIADVAAAALTTSRLRVKKEEDGTTYYLRSSVLGGQVVAELNSTGGWVRGYVYLGGQMLAIQANNSVTWVHQDPATKSQRLTDAAGAVTTSIDLDPWGTETARSVNSTQQPRKYTTYERDGNSSNEAMMRRYTARHQRFDQPDPYDGSYDLSDPQSFNRYAYISDHHVHMRAGC